METIPSCPAYPGIPGPWFECRNERTGVTAPPHALQLQLLAKPPPQQSISLLFRCFLSPFIPLSALTTLPPLPSAGNFDDLHSFDPATMIWTLLSAADDASRPSARRSHGFTSAGGLLYVHGGITLSHSVSLSLSFSITHALPLPLSLSLPPPLSRPQHGLRPARP
jgi:hypothetical protein